MWYVLIAEDNSDDLTRLTDGLKPHAEYALASNGQEALSLYQESIKNNKPFDFILLDVSIPGKDGFEVLKTIRAQEENFVKDNLVESRIIMITTYKDSLMENYNMGWNDFITKPVDIDILIKRMKEMKTS